MVPLSIFNKSFQKCILLGYFLTPQIPGSSLRNIFERQESSGRLWLRKRLLYEKQPAKNATSCFRIFIVPIFICLFREFGKLLPNFCYVAKFYILATIGS